MSQDFDSIFEGSWHQKRKRIRMKCKLSEDGDMLIRFTESTPRNDFNVLIFLISLSVECRCHCQTKS